MQATGTPGARVVTLNETSETPRDGLADGSSPSRATDDRRREGVTMGGEVNGPTAEAVGRVRELEEQLLANGRVIGACLLQARASMPPGQYDQFLHDEFGWTFAQAEALMRVYDESGDDSKRREYILVVLAAMLQWQGGESASP
jgi:hypothetical protein